MGYLLAWPKEADHIGLNKLENVLFSFIKKE